MSRVLQKIYSYYDAGTRKLKNISFINQKQLFDMDVMWCRYIRHNQSFFDKKVRMHSHSFYELHCVMNGSYAYTQDGGDAVIISAGEFIMVSPRVSHVIKPIELDSETFAVAFDPVGEDEGQALKLLSALRSLPSIKGEVTQTTAALIEMIMDEAHESYLLGTQNIKSMLLMIVIELARNAFPNDILFVDKDALDGENERFREIKRFLLDNQDKIFSVEDLARNMNISAKYLGNIIRASTGLSAKQFIDKLKSEKAKKLLLDTDLTIYEISYKLGFEDCNNFNRFFKRVEGMPPGVFRNAKGKKVR